MLSKKYWGQGLGTEVAQALMEYGFGQLKLKRLICCIVKENRASVNVAAYLGLTFEKEVHPRVGPQLLYSKRLTVD